MMYKQKQNWQGIKVLLLTTFLLTSFLGCKKDLYNNDKYSSTNRIENAKNWYAESKTGFSNTIRSSKGLAVVLTFVPQWDKAEVLEIDNKSIISMPVKTNLQKLNRETEYYLLISEVDNKYEYKTVAVKDLKNNGEKLNLNDLYLSAFTDESLPLSTGLGKEISVLGQHFEMQKIATYDNTGLHLVTTAELSKLNNAKREKTKLNGTKNNTVVTECIDYYLITQYYDQNNTYLYETSLYLGRECETRQIDFIDPDPNGTGGTSESRDSAKVIIDFGSPVTSEATSENVSTGDSIITQKLYWTFHEAGTYKFKSRELATKRLMSEGGWIFIGLEHLSHYVVGTVYAGEVEIYSLTSTRDISRLKEATMYLEYRVRLRLTIANIPATHYSDYDETFKNWDIDFN